MKKLLLAALLIIGATIALIIPARAQSELVRFETVYASAETDGRNESCSYEKDIINLTDGELRVSVVPPLQLLGFDGSVTYPVAGLEIPAGESARARLYDLDALKTATVNETTDLVFWVNGVAVVDSFSVAPRCGDPVPVTTTAAPVTTTEAPVTTTEAPVTATTLVGGFVFDCEAVPNSGDPICDEPTVECPAGSINVGGTCLETATTTVPTPETVTISTVPTPETVTICHVTNSASNPWVILTIPVTAFDGEGANDHAHHESSDGRVDKLASDGACEPAPVPTTTTTAPTPTTTIAVPTPTTTIAVPTPTTTVAVPTPTTTIAVPTPTPTTTVPTPTTTVAVPTPTTVAGPVILDTTSTELAFTGANIWVLVGAAGILIAAGIGFWLASRDARKLQAWFEESNDLDRDKGASIFLRAIGDDELDEEGQ